MEQAIPKPSLWLARLTPRQLTPLSDGRLWLQNASASLLPTGLLVAGTDTSGAIYAYEVKQDRNAASAGTLDWEETRYKLFLRYSLSVRAFGVPGDGEIWVGSQEVSRPLGQLCFLPGTRERVTFQTGSKKLLSIQLGHHNQEDAENLRVTSLEEVDPRVLDGPDFRESFPVSCIGSCVEQLSCVAVREDGGAVAAADERGGIRVWAISDGQMLGELDAADWASGSARSPVNALAFGGSEVLVGACSDGAVRIWGLSCLPELELLDSCTTLEKSPLVGLAVHWHDATRERPKRSPVIAAGAADGMLHIWQAVSERRWDLLFVADHALGEGSLSHIAFCGQGSLLATCASGEGVEQRHGFSEDEEDGGETVRVEGHCPVRVYETQRWGCLAEHSDLLRSPVLIHSVGKSVAVEQQAALLLLSREGSLSMLLDPHKPTSRLSQKSGAPSSVANAKSEALEDSSLGDVPGKTSTIGLGRLPQKRVSLAPGTDSLEQYVDEARAPAKARERTSNMGIEADEIEQAAVNAKRFSTDDGSTERQNEAVGLYKEMQEKSSLVIEVDEAENEMPTPSPLPTRLATLVKAAPQKQTGRSELQPKIVLESAAPRPIDGNEPVHPSCYLSEPTLHSSARLLVQLEQLRAQQFDTKAAIQSVAAGSRPASVKAELAGLAGELSLGDFAKLGGEIHVTEQYTGLTPLEDEVPPEALPRPLGKQVDSRWQAALAEPPRLESLWVAEQRRPQVCDVAPVYWPPKEVPNENEEQSMATWSCLMAIPR